MLIISANQLPSATLSNGVRVLNYSSGHDFTFEDGTVLKANTEDRCKDTMLRVGEQEISKDSSNTNLIKSIKLKWFMQSDMKVELLCMMHDVESWAGLTFIIVPLPVMTAIRNVVLYTDIDVSLSPFRVVRLVKRAVNNEKPIVSINKFCV